MIEANNPVEEILKKPKIYLFLDARTGEFDEITSEAEFNKLQFLQNVMWGKTIEHISDNYVFGGDGRYSPDYFIKRVEKWKKLNI